MCNSCRFYTMILYESHVYGNTVAVDTVHYIEIFIPSATNVACLDRVRLNEKKLISHFRSFRDEILAM